MKTLLVITFVAGVAAAQPVHADQQNMPTAQKAGTADKASAKPTSAKG